MKALLSKNMLAAVLIAIVSGAFFACLTFGSFASSHAQHDPTSSHQGAATHILHAQELSLSIVDASLLALVAFLLLIAVFPLVAMFARFVVQHPLPPFRYRKRDIFFEPLMGLESYLARFVRSPEFLRSA